MRGKKCSACGRYLPLSYFTRSLSSWNGYQSQCKDCKRDYAAKAYSKMHPDAASRPLNRNEKMEQLVREAELRSLQYCESIRR